IHTYIHTSKPHTNDPLVTVIMPTYNRSHEVEKAIQSILSQTYKNFEFIIINDGSQDNTLFILKKWQKKDKRIILLNNEKNMGISSSLNKALKIAKGKYISRMDDDDISLPTRLEKQVRYLENNPSITVLGTAIKVPNTNKINRLSSSPEESAILSHFQVPVYHPTTLIRHDFLKKHNLNYQKKYDAAEDTLFWYDIIKKGGKITNLSEPLVIQNIHSKKNYKLDQQALNYNKFIQQTLSPILKDKMPTYRYPISSLHACIIVKEFQKINYKNLASNKAITTLLNRYCTQDVDEYFYIKTKNQLTLLFLKNGKILNKYFKLLQLKKINQDNNHYLELYNPKTNITKRYELKEDIYHLLDY
ncbi:MAG: glycosyltransferase family 2 protein, partial [Alphaproteobacteria bacterium]|nr:glycosyltransferase family 2 protein [Alphaproteobacteria bacterium]